MSDPLYLVGLEAENVKRVRLVRLDLDPEGGLTVVGGENEQGKSSLLDAIEQALGGAAAEDHEPLRRGAARGRTRLRLVAPDGAEIMVEKRYTPKGSSLHVTTGDGAPVRSPQALLDGFVGALSFDPLAFATMEPRKRAAALMALGGLDFADLDAQAAGAREARTLVGRDVRQLEALTAGDAPIPADTPRSEVSVVQLSAALERGLQAERALEDARRRATEAARALAAQAKERDGFALEIERLEELLATTRQKLDEAEATVEEATSAAEKAREAVEVALSQVPDLGPLRAQIQSAEATNALVRARKEREARRVSLDDARRSYDDLTREIDGAEEERRARIAAAAFPVPGLGFDAAGMVTLDGIPFEQASTGAKLRTSLAIGIALNPRLRLMIVREGSMLDRRNLALVAREATERGFRVLMERVGDGDEVSVVIEDGLVLEDRRIAAPEGSRGDPDGVKSERVPGSGEHGERAPGGGSASEPAAKPSREASSEAPAAEAAPEPVLFGAAE